MKMTRRQFLQGACAACLLPHGRSAFAAGTAPVEARFYRKLPQRKIECTLCPRRCVIDDLERGYCGVRENQGGTYYTLVYGKACSANIDPIEKKPLFHYLPGAKAFSIATVGCNVMCKFCQNWEISQANVDEVKAFDLPPQQVAAVAAQRRCEVIAYTYTEPVVFYEYMYDCAAAGRRAGVRSVMISNGYINPEPMRELCRVLDAVKIDLKAFNNRFYKELVSGELQPVLDTLVLLKKEKMWTEIVYLVIPGKNDDPGELREMCGWIKSELGADTPVHFSRFHPQYRLTNVPATPPEVLRRARQIGLQSGLRYVYTGNIPGDEGENTYCPRCGKVVIRRFGFSVLERTLKNGACASCGTPIAGVWN